MIIGKIHPGSGLGDQLFSYIATRVIALDKGYDFGFVGKEFFKGKDFLSLDWGTEPGYWYHEDEGQDFVKCEYHIEEPAGKLVLDNYGYGGLFEVNKPYYDPEVNFIEDGTIIDGYGAQDERYFMHRLDEVREWLKVDSQPLNNGVCVINFRGGEFAAVPELFLPPEYWESAIKLMTAKHPGIQFEVHTDDPKLASQFFPGMPVIQNIGLNWRAILNARHLIISNSAFAIIPALLNENVQEVIAPKYWNRRNLGRWDWPMNYYKKFTYV